MTEATGGEIEAAAKAACRAVNAEMDGWPWDTSDDAYEQGWADGYRAVEARLRAQIADELRTHLHELSDVLDPVEGPVILAWSTDVLADRLAVRVARGTADGGGQQ